MIAIVGSNNSTNTAMLSCYLTASSFLLTQHASYC